MLPESHQLLSPSISKYVPSVSSSKESPTNSGLTTIDHHVTTISDEDDADKGEDENCDTISVTGSPARSSVDIEDMDRKSTPPPSSGAFTALIQKPGYKKFHHEFLPHLGPLHQPFNQALAAQLFLQNPIIPSSSQWLYNQLYGSQQSELWFRHALRGDAAATAASTGVNLMVKKDDCSDVSERKSPSVSSTKRSPSPMADEINAKKRRRSTSEIDGNSSPKHTADVWRPY